MTSNPIRDAFEKAKREILRDSNYYGEWHLDDSHLDQLWNAATAHLISILQSEGMVEKLRDQIKGWQLAKERGLNVLQFENLLIESIIEKLK